MTVHEERQTIFCQFLFTLPPAQLQGSYKAVVPSISRNSHKIFIKPQCFVSCLVMSNCLQPFGLQPARLPSLWDSPGKNNGVGCHFLLQCMKVKSESEVTQLGPKNCVSNKFSGNAHVACSRITLSDSLPNTTDISIFFFLSHQDLNSNSKYCIWRDKLSINYFFKLI